VTKNCPVCDSDTGIRIAIYGMPSFEPSEAEHFIAGCTSDGQKNVCINCRWGIEDEGQPKISISYDMRSDAYGKDPDRTSQTLKRYHKYLWSKPLPNGHFFNLESGRSNHYLLYNSYISELSLSSDSIGHSYKEVKKMRKVLVDVAIEDVESFRTLNSTIGGFIIFPARKIDGNMTINQERGTNSYIADRFDLTLECIRRHYEGGESPLSKVLGRYTDFFDLFQNFEGYINFFLLNDLVDSQFGKVNFFTETSDLFETSPLPRNKEEYLEYRVKSMRFVEKRNQRILEWAGSN
jgi:hypothetical protein